MKTVSVNKKTNLNVNETEIGKTIEQKVEEIVNKKEKITDSAPLIWQPRKDGVNPSCDIRTDKWEIAVGAADAITASKIAKRVDFYQPKTKTDINEMKDKKEE